MPFRIVAFADSAPYLLQESQASSQQQQMVDLISGERFQRVESFRQPIAEDFLRRNHPRPAPPVAVYKEDQHLPIFEPDEHFESESFAHHEARRPQSASAISPQRSDSVAYTRTLSISKTDPSHRRSKSAADIPVVEAEAIESESNAKVVPDIGMDEFSPVLGGLHRLPSAPARKPSKLHRLKRFLSSKQRRA